MKIRFSFITAAVAVALVASTAQAQQQESHPFNPADPATVAQGKTIYLKRCASCHGKKLEGSVIKKRRSKKTYAIAPAHDATGHTAKHTHQELFDVTKNGRRIPEGQRFKTIMPGFGRVLSDDKIWAVLSYIEAQWSQETHELHDKASGAEAHEKHSKKP